MSWTIKAYYRIQKNGQLLQKVELRTFNDKPTALRVAKDLVEVGEAYFVIGP